MNLSLIELLVSPIDRKPLRIKNEDQTTDIINNLQQDDGQLFPVIGGVPILLPPGYIADYGTDLSEILFGEAASSMETEWAHAGIDEWELRRLRALQELGRDGVLTAFHRYSSTRISERLKSFVRLGNSDTHPEVSAAPLKAWQSFCRNITHESASRRVAQFQSFANGWASHLSEYVSLVVNGSPRLILELGTGAGLGTYAVIERLPRNCRFISVDIDLACVGNALGLATFYNVSEWVDAVVASFWYLPFGNETVDVICAHLGIDESREVPRVIEEVSRVLVRGGRFVGVSRLGLTRLQDRLGKLNITEQETQSLAKQACLYSGLKDLEETALHFGLELEDMTEHSPNTSHPRVVYVFRKTG